MKTRLSVLFALIMSLVLLSPWGVVAQGPKPTPTPPRVKLFQRPDRPPSPRPASAGQWNYEKPFPRALAPKSSTGVRSPRISLGQPGLSFRYVQTFGTTEHAYPDPGTNRLNGPTGLFIDSSDNLYVVENMGDRVLRYSSGGTNTLARGTAGLCVSSNNNPIGFCGPQDVALYGGGNFWVADGDRVVQFDSNGVYQRQLPVPDANGNWSSGSGQTTFNSVGGIAFDASAGRMFVSDMNNNRVQVYDYTGSGSPTYSATIPGFNSPQRLAVDSTGHYLYVADRFNGQVQRCSYAGTWTCTPFGPGLNQPQGIAVDISGNVYIADSNNNQVWKCDSGGTCNTLISNLPSWVPDVAVDSSGNVYFSDSNRAEVLKYDITSHLISTFVGVTNQPYVADTTPATPLLNRPWGIAVALDGSIYVAEDNGYRLVKLNSAGTRQWAVGQAGVWGDDGAHFGYLEGKPAIASNGRIYVPDTGNNRIMIFDANGNLVTYPFGGSGQGPYQFSCPGGIAISPVNGDFYIADRCNQRVQVFDSNLIYKTTLGTTNEWGTDNTHFNNPYDVAFDSSGNAYIADSNNNRVQKCTVSGTSYACTTFAGVTGEYGNDFDHLGWTSAVATDSAGRIYVGDGGNNRVQVFNSSGAYLTTIGGSWGSNTGQLRSSASIAIDSNGNVYVADSNNDRIQKFAAGVPGWKQVNINGFGDPDNGVESLEVFNGKLYAGTSNGSSGAVVWRSSTGSDWTAVSQPGFSSTYTNTNAFIYDMVGFKGQLYAATGAYWPRGVAGQIWRCSVCDGNDWSPVRTDGFGNSNNLAVMAFGVFSNTLYASTYNDTDGLEIWRSGTGNSSEWTHVVLGGNGNPHNYNIASFMEFNGYFYTAAANTTDGMEIWRTQDGSAWTAVATGGIDNSNNQWEGCLAVLGGNLYVGTGGGVGNRVARVYRSGDGTHWNQVGTDGFGDSNNQWTSAMTVFDGALYASTYNVVTGTEVRRSSDGNTWSQVNPDGFGDSNNQGVFYSSDTAVFKNRLYLGPNGANGGEVWQLINQLYLPLIKR